LGSPHIMRSSINAITRGFSGSFKPNILKSDVYILNRIEEFTVLYWSIINFKCTF